ncbi:MAG: DNA alkylation repair protein [Chloroflexi bacterium]|nr:DNA alkylation repair protein [Chloroflexota bacterium]
MNERLKDMYFKRAYFEHLAAIIPPHHPAFDGSAFLAGIYDAAWDNRALKEKMRHTTQTLHACLPDDYRTALGILRQIVPHLAGFGFENAVLPDFVELYGLDDWEASLPALELFTQLMSAEFAVRPFILQNQARMMAQMLDWAGHEHPAVRRLASEGCRPRLPWAIALGPLQDDPAPILPILDRLKLDPVEDVRRSVANNLNDIAKDNPDVTLGVLRGWQSIDTDDIRRLTNHALRTLLKQGHPGALELLGYSTAPAISISQPTLSPESIPIGAAVTFEADITSTASDPQPLMIDYVVHHMRARGQQTPKVFKLSKREIAPGETIHIRREHAIKTVSTRKIYPGAHAIELQINGQIVARWDFEVTAAE